jgi:hypothetical protein
VRRDETRVWFSASQPGHGHDSSPAEQRIPARRGQQALGLVDWPTLASVAVIVQRLACGLGRARTSRGFRDDGGLGDEDEHPCVDSTAAFVRASSAADSAFRDRRCLVHVCVEHLRFATHRRVRDRSRQRKISWVRLRNGLELAVRVGEGSATGSGRQRSSAEVSRPQSTFGNEAIDSGPNGHLDGRRPREVHSPLHARKAG